MGDAATGTELWRFEAPPFTHPAAMGDEEWLLRRIRFVYGSEKAPEAGLACIPDSWAQATIGGDGTVYAGSQDGYLYAVKDADGDGLISKEEVSSYDFGHALQASQG